MPEIMLPWMLVGVVVLASHFTWKAWLGVATQVVTPDVATALGAKDLRGFRITQVYPGTEASKPLPCQGSYPKDYWPGAGEGAAP